MKLLASLTALVIGVASAQDLSTMERLSLGARNTSDKLLTCSVYFALLYKCGGAGKEAEKFLQVSSELADYNDEVIVKQKLISKKAAEAKVVMMSEDMMKDIDNSCNNIAVTIQKYGRKEESTEIDCIRISNKPTDVLKEELEKQGVE